MTRRAFSLLEVIVAIGILSVSLTAIFASESGAVRASMRAQHLHVATLLARCKMGELEEKVMREGLPAAEAHGRDECCDGAELAGYTCEWTLTPIVMPTAPESQQSSRSGSRSGGANEAASEAMGRVGTAADFLAGGGDRGGLEAAVLSLAVPVLNPAIEAQVRRASVEVHWQEGTSDRSFEVAQFLVNEHTQNTEITNPVRGAR